MNKNNWNNALNHIDPDLVEEFVQAKDKLSKNRINNKVLFRIGTIAACLCLIFGAVIAVPFLSKDPIDDTSHNSSTPPVVSSNRPQLPSSSPVYYGSDSSIGSATGGQTEANPAGISVTARLLETLPDTYTFYDDWRQNEFRLLKMEVITLLKGAEMTDIFYYIIPVAYMTDYTLYDKFVIFDMAQYGYEFSVLYNKTQGCAEQLDLVLFGYVSYSNNILGEKLMAFDKNGKIDKALWRSTESWVTQTEYSVNYYADNYTIQDAESAAQETGYKDLYVHQLKDITGGATDVLSDIRSFKNGLFIPTFNGSKLYLDPEVQLRYVRYINGFSTNESVSIYSKELNGGDADIVKFSKSRFTNEDENNLPNLSSAIAYVADAYDIGEVIPPHYSYASESASVSYGIFGWYAKTENEVVGIVRVTWRFYRNFEYFYDDSYYIIEYGSDTCRPIDRDDLLEKLGNYNTDHIYNGEYDENGKILDEVPYA